MLGSFGAGVTFPIIIIIIIITITIIGYDQRQSLGPNDSRYRRWRRGFASGSGLCRFSESWMNEKISMFARAALSAVVACMIAVRILYSVDPRTKVIWRRK